MKTDRTVTRTAKLSKRLSATMTVGQSAITVEWEPAGVPTFLTRQERRKYRKLRDACMFDLSRLLGGPVAVLEM